MHDLAGKALARFLRRETGFLFQFGNLLSYLTVAENVAFPLRLNNVPPRECMRRAWNCWRPSAWLPPPRPCCAKPSGGEVQRVAFRSRWLTALNSCWPMSRQQALIPAPRALSSISCSGWTRGRPHDPGRDPRPGRDRLGRPHASSAGWRNHRREGAGRSGRSAVVKLCHALHDF